MYFTLKIHLQAQCHGPPRVVTVFSLEMQLRYDVAKQNAFVNVSTVTRL